MVAQLFKDPACPLVLAVVEDGEAFEKRADPEVRRLSRIRRPIDTIKE